MATKICPNGHQYDSSIYGDKCPFCPENSHTHVSSAASSAGGTHATSGYTPGVEDNPTIPMQPEMNVGGHTVIRKVSGTGASNSDGGRKVTGLLVSYSRNPSGEIFSIYEGRNIIGRAATCDICFGEDDKMSGTHLLILYREAEGVFWAVDQNSSNGTYINGQFASDKVKLKTNDVIVLGGTKMIFLGIPSF